MVWLMGEMLWCLLLAFLIGLLAGWLWTKWRCGRRCAEIESEWSQRLDSCEERLADARTRQARSAAAAAKAADLQAAAKADQAAAAISDAEAEDEALRQRLGLVDSTSTADAAAGVASAAVASELDPEASDDLKQVEGIGPKIEQLLNAAGIRTWAQLAGSESAQIREILRAAGERYRVHDPTTWPEQAGLAAAGKWEELAQLQDLLDGGRRPG